MKGFHSRAHRTKFTNTFQGHENTENIPTDILIVRLSDIPRQMSVLNIKLSADIEQRMPPPPAATFAPSDCFTRPPPKLKLMLAASAPRETNLPATTPFNAGAVTSFYEHESDHCTSWYLSQNFAERQDRQLLKRINFLLRPE